jgi:hypothetical protein
MATEPSHHASAAVGSLAEGSRAAEQASAAQRPVEKRRQADDAEQLEGRGEEGVAGIFLADPSSAGKLHPLGESRVARVGAGQVCGQGQDLGGGQG